MGSQMNFKNSREATSKGDSNQKLPTGGIFPLTRQPSVYSLTFDEFQNTWGGLPKDFGSMNMDELLKNIWTAEESQAMMYNSNNNNNIINNGNNNTNSLVNGGVEVGGVFPGENLQRQGSFTLPRTLSQKTVDEVWRELMKESESGGVANCGSNVPERQPTFGEMTLEEFLVRAGVVKEDPQPIARPSNCNGGFYGFCNDTIAGLAQNNNGLLVNNGFVSNQPAGLAINGSRIQSSQPMPQQQEPLFPKQATVAFANPNLVNGAQPAIQDPRNSVVGVVDRSGNNNLVQAVDLKPRVTVASVSPVSPDLLPKCKGDVSLSPVPFVFGGGRKSGAGLEKVIERRQKRMIKNRESAARSRARKQAYTLELEAEVAKLKELNEELQRKQAEIMKMQKNQLLEPMTRPLMGCKRQCLRRTLTGPW